MFNSSSYLLLVEFNHFNFKEIHKSIRTVQIWNYHVAT